MLILDPLRKQRVHADSLGLAFDRDEIDLDQFRIAETRSREERRPAASFLLRR